ncbi:MAG TPA: uracil phosphoribosyltransferase [Bdellovibrionota bacterium]|jgi:uracil phosphoribosyltransferase|nr:uracil phosphoribosyltransferase [Bdellovibrionota bacterium]
MNNLKVLDHPVLQHHLSILRDKTRSSSEFRRALERASSLMAFEATRDLALKTVEVQTPFETAVCKKISDAVVIVPILRAGLGMVDGFLSVLPFAAVGHVGIYRDKVMNHTVEYYFKLPEDHQRRRVLLLDPLLATGDTALAALDRLKEYGVGPIRFVTLLSCETGIQKVMARHPDVEIYTVSVERELNPKGYLLPGLGDAGDRLFNTPDMV